MASLTPRLSLLAVAALGMVSLAACTPGGTPSADGTAGGGNPGSAKFAACLTAAGFETKVTPDGQVAVASDIGTDADGGFSVGSNGEDSGDQILGILSDDTGKNFVIAQGSGALTEDPDLETAYADCEKKFPDFEQPEPTFTAEEQAQAEKYEKETNKASQAFAKCARAAGYTDIPDADAKSGVIFLPDSITETDFRAIVDTCVKEGDALPAIATTPDGLDQGLVIDILSERVGVSENGGVVVK